eukprot:TRINITY_DN103753_c0_g1_i1.p1 TRINITY_DN103753_c0_g1~~TRINITY_DN103753_c0_g1_i1.p1  ORF type:complete len:225 (-),score=61.38 TRINITY_DN103753_c0_g1_i1:195-869(-)
MASAAALPCRSAASRQQQTTRKWGSLSGRRVLLSACLMVAAVFVPRAFFSPTPDESGPRPPGADAEGEEWKDESWRRQQDFLQERLNRFGSNKRASSERILWMKKRQATWRAMAERGSEKEFLGDDNSALKGLVEQEDGLTVTVKLKKPLGLNLAEINPSDPCGALIQDISKGYSADEDGTLEIGDVLTGVNGKLVWGKPFEQAIQPIADAEGEVTLTFFRYDM